MNDEVAARFMRADLDRQSKKLRKHACEAPKGGWIRAVRLALGMTTRQPGARMGNSGHHVADLERAEVNGTIRLKKLREIGKAMECRLVYAYVPETSLEEIYRERKKALARRQLERIMGKRRAKSGAMKSIVESLAEKIPPHQVWDDMLPLDGLIAEAGKRAGCGEVRKAERTNVSENN